MMIVDWGRTWECDGDRKMNGSTTRGDRGRRSESKSKIEIVSREKEDRHETCKEKERSIIASCRVRARRRRKIQYVDMRELQLECGWKA